MNVSRRSILGAGSSLAALGLLTACGGSGGSGAAPAGKAEGKVTYLSQSAGGDAREQEERKLFADFSAQNPKIPVEIVVVGGAGGGTLAKEKFTIAVAGGQPMDLVQNTWGVWTDMSEGGQITELTPFYKVDLFKANNIPEPPQNPEDKTWTMEKFLDVAQKLTRSSEQFGFGGSVSSFNV